MIKQEIVDAYIKELKSDINSLQSEEQVDILEFYREFILDSDMETKEDIESELGTSKKLARKILADYSVSTKTSVDEKVQTSKSKKENQMKTIWVILLGLLAIPTAIPAAIAMFGILFGLFMAVFGIFLGFIGMILGLIIGGIVVACAGLAVIFSAFSTGLFYLGSGLFCIMLGLMMAPGAYYVIKILVNAITSFAKWVGKKFFNKQYYKTREEV